MKEQEIKDLGFEIQHETIESSGAENDWYTEWTMTTAQCEEWREWGVAYLRKNLKINKVLAEKKMMWFNLQFGLKFE